MKRRKWIDEHAYADLVALCQFPPGPASSQLGIAIGLSRGRIPGAVAAWLGFTLPSALLLVLFGLGLTHYGTDIHAPWLHGLKLAAAAVVAQAVWGMSVKLCPDRERASIAVIATIIALTFTPAWIQLAVIFLGGIAGALYFKKAHELPHAPLGTNVSHRTGLISITLYLSLLVLLPFLVQASGAQALRLFDSFYRVGALVFGGGHVVLPLLQTEVVNPGWISKDVFLAGYGAAQAVPGPLFTFAAYIGAVSKTEVSGWLGAGICLIAIFLPGFLLIIGALPLWEHIRKFHTMRNAMLGVNAAVVGLLLAALYNPVWTSAVLSPKDFCVVLAAFALLVFWKAPSWAVVILSALAGWLIL